MMFDGLLDTADLIALDVIIENLPDNHRTKFIDEMKKEEPEDYLNIFNTVIFLFVLLVTNIYFLELIVYMSNLINCIVESK